VSQCQLVAEYVFRDFFRCDEKKYDNFSMVSIRVGYQILILTYFRCVNRPN